MEAPKKVADQNDDAEFERQQDDFQSEDRRAEQGDRQPEDRLRHRRVDGRHGGVADAGEDFGLGVAEALQRLQSLYFGG